MEEVVINGITVKIEDTHYHDTYGYIDTDYEISYTINDKVYEDCFSLDHEVESVTLTLESETSSKLGLPDFMDYNKYFDVFNLNICDIDFSIPDDDDEYDDDVYDTWKDDHILEED